MVEASYLLGVDIGTYASKGVITRPDGEVVSVQVRSHDLTIPRSGWAEHEAEAVWWGDFVAITRDLLDETGLDPKRIAAVGCSAIGPDLLPVDASGRPLRRGGILYGIDTRATAEIAELEGRYGAEAIFEATGNALTSQAVGPKLLWLKRHEPEVYRRADTFVTATTFIVARLTGRFVIDHLTASTWVPLYDLAERAWSDRFCDDIVDPERLPAVAWATEIAGRVTAAAAAQTGLAEGTPVIVGTADAPAEAVSVGVTAPGQMMLMYGSTVFMVRVTDRLVTDRRLWAVPYLFPDTWCLEAGMSTSGALTRWFRDQCAPDLVATEAAGGPVAYAALARGASSVPPGSDGLMVLPYFSGERTPINDPEARGVIFGLTLAHTRDHIFRAILEGIGYGVRHHIDVMTEIDVCPEEVVAVGGGTQNELWLQIVSDIAEVAQRVPAITLGASYGDAFLAGLGVGMFDAYRDVDRWLGGGRTIEPDAAHAARYRSLMDLYLELYRRTKDMMATLGRLT
jgi:xylulokinase